ncbi:MAG: hypothetical protein R6X02_09675 [Enhygromyxa sp.]
MSPLLSTARSSALARLSLLATLGLAACNFEVPSSSYLVETRLLGVLVEVVELGPLHPGRVAVPIDAPIAEALPHDRLAFDAVVVDREGRRLPDAELDSLWFQCGAFDCGEGTIDASSELFDRDCDALEDTGLPWNTDSVCRLGQGDGHFDFVVPDLGQLMTEQRIAHYYGVIGWEGRSASSCWSARRSKRESLDGCGFIRRSLRIGPSWWMLTYAESLGLQSPVPLHQLPAGVFIQLANRVPIVSLPVVIDGQLRGTWPEQTQFEVEPGARISIDPEYDEVSQFLQTYFRFLLPSSDSFVFVATTEILREIPYSSNAIVWLGFDPDAPDLPIPPKWEFVVDEYAEAGTSRIILWYYDDRFAEGVATLEFEVKP